MASQWSQIKLSRILLIGLVTFLLTDNIPHPNLGPGLLTWGTQKLQEAWIAHQETSTQTVTVQPEGLDDL